MYIGLAKFSAKFNLAPFLLRFERSRGFALEPRMPIPANSYALGRVFMTGMLNCTTRPLRRVLGVC
jgi:hypothetical protein